MPAFGGQCTRGEVTIGAAGDSADAESNTDTAAAQPGVYIRLTAAFPGLHQALGESRKRK